MDNIVIPSAPSTENMSFQVYADIRMKLITGKLMPDQALSIRTLATEYDISAMPVREALRQLASEDALIGAAKKAYRVPNLLSSEAANLFYVRAVLEGAAAEIVAGVIDNLSKFDLWQSDHDAIIDALANNDAATARTLMENDSGWGRKLYQEKM